MIIVTVLINSGLLTILFATAMNTQEDPFIDRHDILQPPMEGQVAEQVVQPSTSGSDEIDEALKVYTEQQASEPSIEQPEPVAAEPEKKQQKDDFVIVTVKRGDFLEKIAKNNKTSVRAIMRRNNLNHTRLRIGQTLKVPLPKENAKVTTTQKVVEAGDDFYTVQTGDNPWVISRRTGIAFEDILKLNNLNEERARQLRPGDRLRIR